MKPRHTLLLLAALALLCGAYAGLHHYRGYREEAVRVARKIFQFEREDIHQLTIVRIGEPSFTAERGEEGVWRFIEPNPTIKPFHRLWERIADTLAALSNEHTVLEHPTDLAPYGLDAPALTLSGEIRDDAPFTVRFGDLEPTQRHRYARIDDGPLFLVTAEAFFELNRALADMRHRFLVDDREAALVAVEFAWIWTGDAELERETGPEIGEESVVIAVSRDTVEAPWRMKAPVEAVANHEAVQALANDIQFAVCSDYIDNPEDLSDYGLNPPRARITVRSVGDDSPQTLLIGSVDESPERRGLFVKREGQDTVLVIDGHMLSLLPRGPLEWRDLRLLTRRISDIHRVEYASEFDRFVLERGEDGGWRLTTPEIEHVNNFAISAFLSLLKEVRGDVAVDNLHARDLIPPLVTISLYYDDGEAAEIPIVPDPEAAENYLVGQDTGGVILLSGVNAQMLLIDSAAFQSREMLRFVKAEVAALAFTFEDLAYHLEKRHGRWVLRAPETMQLHNQADVDSLIDAVNPLQAAGIVQPTRPDDLSRFGLDAPLFSLEITLDEKETPVTLQIGATNPDNSGERFAVTSLREGLFLVSQEVIDTIREVLRGIH